MTDIYFNPWTDLFYLENSLASNARGFSVLFTNLLARFLGYSFARCCISTVGYIIIKKATSL